MADAKLEVEVTVTLETIVEEVEEMAVEEELVELSAIEDEAGTYTVDVETGPAKEDLSGSLESPSPLLESSKLVDEASAEVALAVTVVVEVADCCTEEDTLDGEALDAVTVTVDVATPLLLLLFVELLPKPLLELLKPLLPESSLLVPLLLELPALLKRLFSLPERLPGPAVCPAAGGESALGSTDVVTETTWDGALEAAETSALVVTVWRVDTLAGALNTGRAYAATLAWNRSN